MRRLLLCRKIIYGTVRMDMGVSVRSFVVSAAVFERSGIKVSLVMQISPEYFLRTGICGYFHTVGSQYSDGHFLLCHNGANENIFIILAEVSVCNGLEKRFCELGGVARWVVNEIVFFRMPFGFMIFFKNEFHKHPPFYYNIFMVNTPYSQ